MATMQLNRLQLRPSFPGVFDHDELHALLAELAPARSLSPLLRMYEGKLLYCRGLETFTDDTGTGVRVAEVVFVSGGEVITAGPLSFYPKTDTRKVFVSWSPDLASLGGESRHVAITTAAASLTSDPAGDGKHNFELMRLKWHREKPAIAAEWWPDVIRIGDDPRSLAAARKLIVLFTEASLERRWFESRLAELSWDDLIPALIRAVEHERTAASAIRSGETTVSAFVAVLLQFAATADQFPEMIEKCRFHGVIEPQRVEHRGEKTIYSFAADPARPAGARLAIIAETSAAVGHTRLKTSDGAFKRPVTDADPSLIGPLDSTGAFELEVESCQMRNAAIYAA